MPVEEYLSFPVQTGRRNPKPGLLDLEQAKLGPEMDSTIKLYGSYFNHYFIIPSFYHSIPALHHSIFPSFILPFHLSFYI